MTTAPNCCAVGTETASWYLTFGCGVPNCWALETPTMGVFSQKRSVPKAATEGTPAFGLVIVPILIVTVENCCAEGIPETVRVKVSLAVTAPNCCAEPRPATESVTVVLKESAPNC